MRVRRTGSGLWLWKRLWKRLGAKTKAKAKAKAWAFRKRFEIFGGRFFKTAHALHTEPFMKITFDFLKKCGIIVKITKKNKR